MIFCLINLINKYIFFSRVLLEISSQIQNYHYEVLMHEYSYRTSQKL
jgi:hypothetical protein